MNEIIELGHNKMRLNEEIEEKQQQIYLIKTRKH